MSTTQKSKAQTDLVKRGKGKEKKGDKKKNTNDKVKGVKEKKTKKKEVITLSVAIYQPTWGNLHHWALHLEPYNYIYQVTGEAMNFTPEVIHDIIPSGSGRYIESIHVGEIQENDLEELHRIITETEVQNDVQGWCCQDYVLEALEALNEEQIVDDEDYEPAKARLMRKFNE